MSSPVSVLPARSFQVRGGLFREETKKKKRKKAAKATLSFALDGEEEETPDNAKADSSRSVSGDNETPPLKRAKLGKNPDVNTEFLPDREREEEERKERERLRQEWLKKQEDLKNEDIEITYSYWDGSGHRKSVTVRSNQCYVPISLIICFKCKKGDTIASFLEKCRQQFPELRGTSSSA